jgi:hypothetical protein
MRRASYSTFLLMFLVNIQQSCLKVPTKGTNNDLQNITQKPSDWTTRAPPKSGGELRCSGGELRCSVGELRCSWDELFVTRAKWKASHVEQWLLNHSRTPECTWVHLQSTWVHLQNTSVHLKSTWVHLQNTSVHLQNTWVHLRILVELVLFNRLVSV